MQIAGIICEYNPLHKGHEKQLTLAKRLLGQDSAVICLMSGNFVQRGYPAIVDKALRAKAAIACGADLVLELPITACLSSAEGFAARGVEILSRLCTHLCFGAETAQPEEIMETARVLNSPAFSPALREFMQKGLSFPAARQAALESLWASAHLLMKPNNILGVEYCKAILSQNSPLIPLPIHRPGDYHAADPHPENPSATALRLKMESAGDWQSFVPEKAREILAQGQLHTRASGEKATLYRLRTMTDAEFAALPYGSEGLWRKLMHAARRENTLEEILTAVKSKRYTRSRLDRMVMCAFLELTEEALSQPVPYVRVLAFNETGRQILRQQKGNFPLCHTGEPMAHPYWGLETRAQDLYGLFAQDGPEPPGLEKKRRIYYTP